MARPIQPNQTEPRAEQRTMRPFQRGPSSEASPGPEITAIRSFLLTGTVSTFGVVVGIALLGFAESIAIARILGESNFGLYSLVVSLLNVSVAVACLGFPPAVMKFLSGEAAGSKSATERTLGTAIRVNVLSSAIAGLAFGLMGAILLIPLTNPTDAFALAGTISVATLGAPFLLFSSALQGQRRIVDLNVRSLLAAICGFGAALVLSVVFSVTGALVAFAAGVFLPGVLSFKKVTQIVNETPTKEGVSGVTIRSLLGYGLPSLSAQLVVLPVISLMNTMLALYWSLSELGLYAAAFTIAGVLSFIPSAVSVPLLPLLSSLSTNDPKRGRILVPRIMRVVSFITVPMALLVVSLSGPIFVFSYGSSYSKSTPYLSILSVAIVLLAISGVVGRQLAGSGLVKWTLLINVAWSAVVATAAVVLIPSFGAFGASIAVLLGYTLTTILSWIVGKKVLEINFAEMRRPAAWTAVFLLMSVSLSIVSGLDHLVIGLGLTAAAILTGLLLLGEREKSLVRDVLLLLRLTKHFGKETTTATTASVRNHRRP